MFAAKCCHNSSEEYFHFCQNAHKLFKPSSEKTILFADSADISTEKGRRSNPHFTVYSEFRMVIAQYSAWKPDIVLLPFDHSPVTQDLFDNPATSTFVHLSIRITRKSKLCLTDIFPLCT